MRFNIISSQNDRIKEINKLKTKKIRNLTGLGIIEGQRIVEDAINQNIEFETIIVLDMLEAKFNVLINKSNCKSVLVVPKTIFDALCNTENSQGIMAVVKIKDEVFNLPKSNFLVLDGIQDPGNLGTIIRTAIALNYKEIYLFNCVDFRNDKVLRATMGTIFKAKLTVINEENLNILSQKKTLLLADAKGEFVGNVKEFENNFGIILCNEGNGASEQVKKLKTTPVAIEMQNNVESLNVSSAGAILMYALKH